MMMRQGQGMHHFPNVSWYFPAFQQPGKQIACRHSKGQGCHQLSLPVIVPSTFPSAAAAVSTRCFHYLWAGLSWDHLVFHFCESHFSPVMWLVSCPPECSKDRREAQRDSVYSSEILGVPRGAIASRVAGGKPNWSQQSFSSTGVSCTDVTQRN